MAAESCNLGMVSDFNGATRGGAKGGQGGEATASTSGNSSPPVGEDLTIRRGMNVRNNMKLSNFDSGCSLVALYRPPSSGNLAPVSGTSTSESNP